MVLPLFFQQFNALFVKNCITFRKHWFSTFLRAVVFPLAFGLFLAFCPKIFQRPYINGLGSAIPILKLQETFDGSMPLYWTDITNGTGALKAQDIVDHLTASFSPSQKSAVKQAVDANEMYDACQANFNGVSGCFMAVVFGPFPDDSQDDTRSFNYTLWTDSTISHYNVREHSGEGETRMLPLQWAIDQAIIELSTGQTLPTVLQQPFSSMYHDVQNSPERWRQTFVNGFGINLAIVLPFVWGGNIHQTCISSCYHVCCISTNKKGFICCVDTFSKYVICVTNIENNKI